MSIPFEHREEACYRFVSSGFKLEETVEWCKKTWADNPTLQRAKYPDTLCANTVTMGGNGDQKQLNVAAFGNAYRRFASETEAQATERARAELNRANELAQELRTQLDAAHRKAGEDANAIQQHLATINRLDRENVVYALRYGDTNPVQNRNLDYEPYVRGNLPAQASQSDTLRYLSPFGIGQPNPPRQCQRAGGGG